MPAWRASSGQMEGDRVGFQKVTKTLAPELRNLGDLGPSSSSSTAIRGTLGSLHATPLSLLSHTASKRDFST